MPLVCSTATENATARSPVRRACFATPVLAGKTYFRSSD
jgi:hypothetical protein